MSARSARRLLATCERNARWAAANDVPLWLAAVTVARLEAARARVAQPAAPAAAVDPAADWTVPADYLADLAGRDQ